MRYDSVKSVMFLVVLGVAAAPVAAQPGPPFFGGGTAFDPEVGIVHSGAVFDAAVTVSADRKYVTVTTGAARSDLRELVSFPVPAIGFVGGANPGGGGGVGGGAGAGGGAGGGVSGVGSGAPSAGAAHLKNGLNTSPSAIANQASVLNRQGMFLLAPLD